MIVAAFVVLAALAGVFAAIMPLASAALGGVSLLGAFILAFQQRIPAYFLGMMTVVLIGYMFLTRSFAHLGVFPIFVGEIAMFFAAIAVLLRVRHARIGAFEWVLIFFILFGLFRTIPYLGQYQLDALRDGVLYGYAFFAFAIAWLIQRQHFDIIQRWYGKLLPLFVFWVPASMLIGFEFAGVTTVPGSDGVPLILPKPGDLGVHLAGIAGFLILGLWTSPMSRVLGSHFLMWSIWLVGVGILGSINRGGMLSALVALSIALLIRPGKQFVTIVLAGVLLITSLALIGPQIDVGYHRDLSVEQVTNNIQSIFVAGTEGPQDGTQRWRLNWWEDIIGYTISGPYFWDGKGFGVNLADVDGYQPHEEGDLRSPHNGHLTILARMGVPGFSMWLLLQGVFAVMVVNGILRAHREGDSHWAAMLGWIFIYWLAMMINSSFDVYLEGPQGGIWFWCIMGLGIAALRIQQLNGTSPQPDAGEHYRHRLSS